MAWGITYASTFMARHSRSYFMKHWNFEVAALVTVNDDEDWLEFIQEHELELDIKDANGIVYWEDGAYVTYYIGHDEIAHIRNAFLPGEYPQLEDAEADLKNLVTAFTAYIDNEDLSVCQGCITTTELYWRKVGQ